MGARLPLVRSLRFRLAAGYLLLFTLMLAVIGVVFRAMLSNVLEGQARESLEEEWAAAKGYLRFENERRVWFYDRFDPEEAVIVDRLRTNGIITDSAGNMLDLSPVYKSLGVDSLDHIRGVLKNNAPVVLKRTNENGIPYMIRQGAFPDEHQHQFFVAIARSLENAHNTVDRFTWRYFALMPVLIVLSGLVGWMLAGRSLQPVRDLAVAAHNITSSNLARDIPSRGAGDELDELIDAFNRMMKRLAQSFEQIRQFSTDVSHELRTPLTAIRGQLEVALFTAKTPEQYQDAMANALQDVEQLSNIVRALLLLSQAESGQLALQMVSVDLTAVCTDMAEQYQIPAEAAAIELRTELAPGCSVRADKTQIERLVSNLLSNAIKYTREGGTVTLRIAQASAESVTLEVADNGIGIPEAQLPHIFDRFYRVEGSSSKAQGLGLGLSFVKWIVDAHCGRISVQSVEGQGSRFTVELPVSSFDSSTR